MPPRYRAMVIVQAGLGLRAGELLALRISDVDWLRRSIRIERQYVEGATEPSEPKTPRSRRTIPAPQVVLDALAAHLAEFPEGDDGLIFTTRRSRRLGHTYYCHDLIGDAVRAAGLPERTTSHALRHHFTSVLLDAGESVVAVAERLGHEDANLVLSTYGHLLANSEDRTRRAIDAAWSCAPDVPQAGQPAASR